MAAVKKDKDLISRTGELVLEVFGDFKRYLAHDVQLENLMNKRFKEYWGKVEQRIREEFKDNGRPDNTAAANA